MRISDLMEFSLKNLFRRRVRSLLALMGVAVGTCAIVAMLSVGFGLSASYQAQMESYGNLHLIQVSKSEQARGPDGRALVLDERRIGQMEKIPGVSGATPVLSAYLYMGIGKQIAESEVIGIKPQVMELFGYRAEKGRLLQSSDRYGLVMGSSIPSQFYDPRKQQYASFDGTGAEIDVFSEKLVLTGDPDYGKRKPMIREETEAPRVEYPRFKGKVTGVLEENDESSYRCVMDLKDLKQILRQTRLAEKNPGQEKQGYDEAWLYVEDLDRVQEVCGQIKEMGFQPHSLNDWLSSMKKTAAMIQGVLGGIGGISLLVAALGITNTMVMSIYERTREIGVMKVIGAGLGDIKRLFLMEAGMIGLGGGLFGVALGFLASLCMNTVLQPFLSGLLEGTGDGGQISLIPWWVALGALAFALFTGLAAGYYPARRAMAMSALESLKNE